ARVLAAVAQAAPDAVAPASRPAWRGGWLVAASVAGLSVLVALQIRPPVAIEQPPAPSAPAATDERAAPADTGSPTPPPALASAPKARATPPRAPAAAPERPVAAPDVAEVAPPPPPPPPPSPSPQMARAKAAPAIASAAAPSNDSLSEIVVTGSRVEESRVAPRAATPVESPSALAAKLRDAAARGRTGELKRLLAKGAPVDMPDDDGETALMRSIRANQPATAALLRRHGASLDLKNGAGESARDMATSIDDAKLNRALGLDG
ncbi:MAG: ankyrin repeat domain-containing protein, partial [Alphaproteobacteria bacterium]|nr:ankyrin repeat domain-containing protein [Alphaproteobacteria bacterium]